MKTGLCALAALLVMAAKAHAATSGPGCPTWVHQVQFETVFGVLDSDRFTPDEVYVRSTPEGDRLFFSGTVEDTVNGTAVTRPAYLSCDIFIPQGETRRIVPGTTQRAGGVTSVSAFPAIGNLYGPGIAAATADEVIAVGYLDRGFFTTYHAFRWTAAAGIIDMGTLDPANDANRTSRAYAVSRNGLVIVGVSQTNATVQHAFRWTAAGGLTDLGAPAGSGRNSAAFAVSQTGDVIVGEADFPDQVVLSGFRSGAFRWTAGGGVQALGSLQAGYFSRANAVTPDGSVIVGVGGIEVRIGTTSTNGSRAFKWTTTSGMQPIGPLTNHRFAEATGVSDDGKVIVGTSTPDVGSSAAFRWTEASGIQDLRQALVNAGRDMTGYQLLTATGVSANGQVIVGQAVRSSNSNERVGYVIRFCDAATVAPCATLGASSPTFALTAPDGGTRTVAAGQSATVPLSITPSGGFSQTVTFACSGLPASATCSFSPATVTPSGTGAVTTTVTIATRASADVVPSLPGTRVPVAILLGAMIAVVCATVLTRRSRPRVRVVALPAVGAVMVCLICVACGGGSDSETTGTPPVTGPPPVTGTPAGAYTVTVTATSGTGASALSRTVLIPLTVTR